MHNDTLAKNFPTVQSIRGTLRFVDPDHMSQPSTKEIVMVPAHNEPWFVRCPFVSCVSGGFSLLAQLKEGVLPRFHGLLG